MFIDSSMYKGKCICGKEHKMSTRFAVIEKDALLNIEKYISMAGIRGKRCTLYGENSYKATCDRHPKTEQEIILKSEGLHANEISTAEVLEKMESDVEVIIAIGSGTIHDIARYCANKRGIRFISCPTAASVDGFCSTVTAMTWYGYKNTMAAVAPEIVVADTCIIKNAPTELVRSGVGDIMAKYIALADWEISHVLTGEHLCQRIYDIMKEAADKVMDSIPGLLNGEDAAFENVTYSLIMSGIAMQMMGNSRPASGAEHHISHMIEMNPAALDVKFPAMHGEKTGVGTLISARKYSKLAAIENIAPYTTAYTSLDAEKVSTFFGETLGEGVMKENIKDCLAPVTDEKLIRSWHKIREIIWKIPSADRLEALLIQLGAKHSLEEIGVSSIDVDKILYYSPMVRCRLTLMRICRMISRV